MKKFAVALLTSVAFVEVIVILIFYKYTNRINGVKGKWIAQGEQESQGNFARNFTTLLQMNKEGALNENSTEVMSLKNISTRCSQLTFGFVSHITQPRFEETSQNPFLLVMITSGVKNSYRTRRNGVRNTWGNEVNHQALRVWKRVFVLGKTPDSLLENEINQESTMFNDILVLDITDNYDNLVIKSYSGLLWGLVHVNPQFILKADDDVYVRIPYLVSWLEYYATDRFYGGHVIPGGADVRRTSNMKNRVARDCMEEDHYAPYCSGAYYVVSSNALPLIFQSMHKWTAIPVEDAYMGLLARESGLKPVDIPGIEFRNIQDYGRCNWASAVALGHNYDILQYTYIQSKLQEHSHLPRYYYECLATEWAGFILIIVIPSSVIIILCTVVKVRSWQRHSSR